MRCEEIMRRDVMTVTPETTLLDAAQRMQETNLGFLPVCAKGALVGVLTDRDIVVRACATGLDLSTTQVADVMTPDPFTCRAGGSMVVAERTMRLERKARLPVVDRRGRLVGVLSLSDVAQYETPRRTGRILFDLTQRGGAANAWIRRSVATARAPSAGSGLAADPGDEPEADRGGNGLQRAGGARP